MQLTGHAGEVYGLRFSPDGSALASCSFDKQIFLWQTSGDCTNYAVLSGHRNAVLEINWFQDGEKLVSAAADKTVRAWDAEAFVQVKKITEHTACVNAVCTLPRGPPLFVSGSDDGKVKVFDLRVKRSVRTLEDDFPVTSVAFAESGEQVYSGGLDNKIKAWELRKGAVAMELSGHSDTVTGLRLSPDGTHLLSNSMDNTLREWDVRPFAPANRCVKVFTGHQHNFEKILLRCGWSADGTRVAAGSADSFVYVWDEATCRILYKLPGHRGSVNDVQFHPKEPVVASASSDRTIFLGELAQ